MLDSNVVATLVTNLGYERLSARRPAARALAELAKHGASSDSEAMQTLI